MKSTSFNQLCAALCQAAATTVPDLDPDAAGNTALAVTVDDVEFVLSHEPALAPMDALLAVTFGPLPSDNPLNVCRVLMDVNSLMLWNQACSFGRDPATRQIVLQYVYSLQDASGPDLYARIREVADIALGWRTHRFLCPAGSSPFASLSAG